MQNGITVVGVGPGDPAYLTQKAHDLIEGAAYVAGFRTALAVVAPIIRGTTIPLDYRNQERGLLEVAARRAEGRRCVICVYGDPNFSDKEFLAAIRRVCGPVDVAPGISSVQIACARAGLAMEETLFITFHQRAPLNAAKRELLEAAMAGRRHILALPHPWDFMPAAMARYLVEGGLPGDRTAMVFERLTLEGERTVTCRLSELAASTAEFSDLSIFALPVPSWIRPAAEE